MLPLPNRVDLIRHPEWKGNLYADLSPLPSERDFLEGPTERGIQQAIRFGHDVLRMLPRPDVVLTSPYLRAKEGARIAVAEAWPGTTVVQETDALIEQNKGTDPADHYDDAFLYNRPYPGGESMREVGRRVLTLLRDPTFNEAHVVAFTHARLMLAMRTAIALRHFADLRDNGLPGGQSGVFIGHCQMDTYLRLPHAHSRNMPHWFTHMVTTEMREAGPRTSALMVIKR